MRIYQKLLAFSRHCPLDSRINMAVAFIHLSDIHFGQEKGSDIIVHDDVKRQLIVDAADVVKKHARSCPRNVHITGDIAYAGS
jgi:hypothetical protein